MSIYEELIAAGVEVANHQSDLYARDTPESAELVSHYPWNDVVTRFPHAITGEMWFEIPFAYSPWWESKNEKYTTRFEVSK